MGCSPQRGGVLTQRGGMGMFDADTEGVFYYIVLNTSAVSSTNLRSILHYASCAMHRPLVLKDVLLF